MNDERKRIKKLQGELKKHDILYAKGNPVILDGEYDALFDELSKLEGKYPEMVTLDSPTQRIHNVVVEGFEKVAHTVQMGSLEKVVPGEQRKGIEKFINTAFGIEDDARNAKVLVQYKGDGITGVLRYKDGILVDAITRGDGTHGDSVISNVIAAVINIPKVLPEKIDLEVRGEIVLPYAEFERVNEKIAAAGGQVYSNPRNLVSGTIRQLDSSIAAERKMLFMAYDIIQSEFAKDEEAVSYLNKLGFEVIKTVYFNADQIDEMYEYVLKVQDELRKDLSYMIDGLVFKVNDMELREDLGSRSKTPRWAMAVKFKAVEAVATLSDVIHQIGRTGRVTPVAIFEPPVDIEGVMVSRASMHNPDYVTSRDLRIGDKVIVERANDVIPQVVMAIADKRDGTEQEYVMPTHCPICESKLEQIGPQLFCTNSDCASRKMESLIFFASKRGLDLDGLGESTVQELYDLGYLTDIMSLYSLHLYDEGLRKIDGLGEKKLKKIYKSIEESVKKPLDVLLPALGIPNLGHSNSKVLIKEASKKFKNLDEFIACPERFKWITSLEGFAEVSAKAIDDWFSGSNLMLIEQLEQLGFNFVFDVEEVGSKFEGKVFVITGAMPSGKKRSEIKKMIEAEGGKVSGSVSKKTNYLVMGPDADGTSKHKKALTVGTTILTEEEFMKMLGN